MSIEDLKSKLEDLNFGQGSGSSENEEYYSELQNFDVSKETFDNLVSEVQDRAQKRSDQYNESFKNSVKASAFQVSRSSLGVGYDAKQVNSFAELLAEAVGYDVDLNHMIGVEDKDQYSYTKFYTEDEDQVRQEQINSEELRTGFLAFSDEVLRQLNLALVQNDAEPEGDPSYHAVLSENELEVVISIDIDEEVAELQKIANNLNDSFGDDVNVTSFSGGVDMRVSSNISI